VVALTNGDYVVLSPDWNGNRGAATWGNGAGGSTGTISGSNSLVGMSASDAISSNGAHALLNGNFIVLSPAFGGGLGAITFGNGSIGSAGIVSSSNSLVGATTNDHVGLGPITRLANGGYVAATAAFTSGSGAVTFGSGVSGVSGVLSASNSLTA